MTTDENMNRVVRQLELTVNTLQVTVTTLQQTVESMRSGSVFLDKHEVLDERVKKISTDLGRVNWFVILAVLGAVMTAVLRQGGIA